MENLDQVVAEVVVVVIRRFMNWPRLLSQTSSRKCSECCAESCYTSASLFGLALV